MLEQLSLDGVRGVIEAYKHQYSPKMNVWKLTPLQFKLCRDPPPEMLEQLTLDGVRGVIEAQLHPTNLELNVAGDFDPEELEALLLRYLGELCSVLASVFECCCADCAQPCAGCAQLCATYSGCVVRQPCQALVLVFVRCDSAQRGWRL
jgi:hypothetical protein